MIIGYARVSKVEQNLNRQIDALESYGVERIISEKITGRIKSREGIDTLLNSVRAGDTVVVESMSRLGRNTLNVMSLIEELTALKVEIVSLKENFDTSTATGKAMMNMILVLLQLERDLLSERVIEGLESAKKRGVKLGRPTKSKDKVKLALELYDSKNYSIKEITKLTGLSTGTLYKYINERAI